MGLHVQFIQFQVLVYIYRFTRLVYILCACVWLYFGPVFENAVERLPTIKEPAKLSLHFRYGQSASSFSIRYMNPTVLFDVPTRKRGVDQCSECRAPQAQTYRTGARVSSLQSIPHPSLVHANEHRRLTSSGLTQLWVGLYTHL